MVADVPDGLGGQSEHILGRGVLVLVEVPVWVLVILVIAVPVSIVAIGGLVVLQPCLVVGAGQRHQVLAHVALRVAQCGAVLHVLTSVVSREVEVYGACRRGDAQVEVVAAHVRVGQDVLVAHVGHRETHSRLA